jgi:cobalamin biosynthesis protein CobT
MTPARSSISTIWQTTRKGGVSLNHIGKRRGEFSMAMTYDEQQTFARLSLWNGQHGQEIRMAETLPDDEEDEDDIEDEDEEIDEEEIDEEDVDEEEIDEEEDEEEES